FLYHATAHTQIYTLSLHDALPILQELIVRERGLDSGLGPEEFIAQEAALEARREEVLRTLLRTCAVPDVTISDEDVFYLHRVKDGFDIYFLTNTSQQHKGRVEITFEQVGKPELWNPNTGEIKPILVYNVHEGR